MRVSAALSTILLFVFRPKTLRADNQKMHLFAASRMRRRRGPNFFEASAGPSHGSSASLSVDCLAAFDLRRLLDWLIIACGYRAISRALADTHSSAIRLGRHIGEIIFLLSRRPVFADEPGFFSRKMLLAHVLDPLRRSISGPDANRGEAKVENAVSSAGIGLSLSFRLERRDRRPFLVHT